MTVGLLSLLSVVCISIYILTPLKNLITADNIYDLKIWIMSYGVIAPVIFILLYIMGTILCFPATILTLMGGVIFHFNVGVASVIIASNIGTILTFWIARALGRSFVEKYLTGPITHIDKQLLRHGLFMVSWIRLMPFFPYNFMNYAFGLTSIRFDRWVIGNFIGMLPWSIGLVSLGTVSSKVSLTDIDVWASPEVWGPITFMVALLILPTMVHIIRARNN